jgi:hypothetical protein
MAMQLRAVKMRSQRIARDGGAFRLEAFAGATRAGG